MDTLARKRGRDSLTRKHLTARTIHHLLLHRAVACLQGNHCNSTLHAPTSRVHMPVEDTHMHMHTHTHTHTHTCIQCACRQGIGQRDTQCTHLVVFAGG